MDSSDPLLSQARYPTAEDIDGPDQSRGPQFYLLWSTSIISNSHYPRGGWSASKLRLEGVGEGPRQTAPSERAQLETESRDRERGVGVYSLWIYKDLLLTPCLGEESGGGPCIFITNILLFGQQDFSSSSFFKIILILKKKTHQKRPKVGHLFWPSLVVRPCGRFVTLFIKNKIKKIILFLKINLFLKMSTKDEPKYSFLTFFFK